MDQKIIFTGLYEQMKADKWKKQNQISDIVTRGQEQDKSESIRKILFQNPNVQSFEIKYYLFYVFVEVPNLLFHH